MPFVYMDEEAAELVELSLVMLETALSARVKRRDPGNIMSNSLTLQAAKLAQFRAMMKAGEPIEFSQLPEPLRRKAVAAAASLQAATDTKVQNRHWQTIRGLALGAAYPQTTEA